MSPILEMGGLRPPGVGLWKLGHVVPARAPVVPSSFPVRVVGGDGGREAQGVSRCRSHPGGTRLQRSWKQSPHKTPRISDTNYKFKEFQKAPSALRIR